MICVDEISKTYAIRSLKKGKFLSYEKKVIPALQNVSFSIADGESVGYVGLNGSGKSTTIKLLAGILCPDSGQIRINGKDPFRDKSLCYEIGAVFGQKQQLWMDLPVGDSFEMLRSIYHVSKSDYTYRMKMIDDFLDFSPLLTFPARKLSLGQRMRCEFAASLLHLPKILLLDEPTIGVDIHVRQQTLALLGYLRKEYGITIFLTTHNLSDIEEICDRIILLNRGQIFYDGARDGIVQLTGQSDKIVFDLEKPIDAPTLNKLNASGFCFTVNEDGELSAIYPRSQPNTAIGIMNVAKEIVSIKSLTIEECKLENVVNELCSTGFKQR